MIEKIIAFSSKNSFIVVLVTLLGIAWGVYAVKHTPLDAIPDLSDPQVIIFTEWMGRSPDLIEDQITYPIVSALTGAPQVSVVRGYSMFGMSFVYLIFKEGTDLYWARSRTLEYLSKIRNTLPDDTNPILGPDASGVGWVFQYSLVDETGNNSIEDLRAFQDWTLRYLLQAVPGVAEVASVGGYVKQYQIAANPNAMAQYGITVKELMDRVRASNRDVGGRVLEISEREYFVRGIGYIKSMADIEAIVVKAGERGESVRVKDIATVAEVPDMRRGAVDLNANGEAASAIVVMRYGQDVYTVIKEVKAVLKRIEPSLPKGTKIVTTYDRSKIISRSVTTLTHKLIEEMLVVAFVIIVFLWHGRSAIVPILTLPIAVILAFIPIYYFGLSLNIMSLGGIAIAIGAMVDAAIILVENAHKALEKWKADGATGDVSGLLIGACQQVGRPIFFSLLVIAIGFMPIFVLEGQEGRLFKPLAFTKNFSMFFAAVLAITLAPLLIQWFLRRPGNIHSEEHHPVSRFLFRIYEPVLHRFLDHRKLAIFGSLLLVLTIIPVYHQLGHEFMPTLNEGDILYMPTTLPGISIETAKGWLQQQDKLILQFPEVDTVFGKVGRAETPTDPAPLSMVETVIQLHPQEQWPDVAHERWYSDWAPAWTKPVFGLVWPEMKARSWQELIDALNREVRLPGTTNAWVFPVKTRIDMLTTGIRTPIGIKVFGDNLGEIERIAVAIEGDLKDVPGTRSIIAERSLGGYYLDIRLRRDTLAAYGLTIEDANEIIEGMIGGMPLTTVIEGRKRFDVTLRYQADFRSDIDGIKRALVTISDKRQVPLSEIAEVAVTQGPSMIKDENGLLANWVYVDLHTGTDMSDYVTRIDERLQHSGLFKEGYTYKISGQYEFMERANKRLAMVIPLTLFIIVLLLYLNTHSWAYTGIVLLAVPFSLIGAFWILWILDYNMSIAVWVGIIALAGVDAETGVVMLLYLDLAYDKRERDGRMHTAHELRAAIIEGAVKRLRPKLMTVLAMAMGLLPIMWASPFESGADVAKRIAAPMIGGIFTSFILELLIYPCIFMSWKTRGLTGADHQNSLSQ